MKRTVCLLAVATLSAALAGCSDDDTSTQSTTSTATTTETTSSSGGGGSAGTGGQGTGGVGVGGQATGGSGTGGTAPMSLTSTGFSEGMVIPDKYACAGQNVSPDLSWTPGPAATQSYAIVFTDKSNNLIHWAIWDIPPATLSLPEHVENAAEPSTPAGAKQAESYDGQTFGYLGPCPGSTHTYEFVAYAVDVATLPGVTTASSRDEVEAALLDHDLDSAALSGTFTP